MTAPRLSVAVMAHPSRATAARRIAADLGGAPIVMDPADGPGTSLRTALLAWAAAEPTATHHLVVQDDVVVSPRLLDRVRAGTELFPDAALSFYANAHAQNAAPMRLAAAAGATWVEGLHECYFPTLATVLPTRYVSDFVGWAGRFTELWEADDRALGRYLIAADIPTRLSVPSFVEHDDQPTIVGTPPRGILKAAVSPPADDAPFHDALASGYQFCPNLYEGRLEVFVRTGFGGRTSWMKGHWPTVLRRLGVPVDCAADALAAAGTEFRGLYAAIDPEFVAGVWDTAFAVGLLVGLGRVPVAVLRGEPDPARTATVRANALLMMVLGGNRGTSVSPDDLAARADELAGLLDRAYHAGARCPTNMMSGA